MYATIINMSVKNDPMNIIFLLNTGPGLVFEVYPEAIGTLPGSQIWSFLFFLTVIMLGMDSAV